MTPLHYYLLATLLTLLASCRLADGQRRGLCNVFEPFRVDPANATFQIGGPFSLHYDDCIFIKPFAVQELIAMQWALTHWNQNPNHAASHLSMLAGDSCSLPKETVSQTIQFLESAAFYEPINCARYSNPANPRLLGLISPRDGDSASAMASLVQTTPVAVAAFTSPAADTLAHSGLPYIISTAPTLHDYLQAAAGLVKALDSNLVSLIVDEPTVGSAGVELVSRHLAHLDIHVGETLAASDSSLASVSSPIVLAVVRREQLKTLLASQPAGSSEENRLLIYAPALGDRLSAPEVRALMRTDQKGQLVVLQRAVADFPGFEEYFIGILKHNYPAYSLFATYMQQVYNCSLVGTPGFERCEDLTEETMKDQFVQADDVGSAVLATYALAAAGRHLVTNRELKTVCLNSDEECARTVFEIVAKMRYKFGEYDPVAFEDTMLEFEKRGNLLVAKGLTIEGYQVVRDEAIGLLVQRVLSFRTGTAAPAVDLEQMFWPNKEPVMSIYRSNSNSQCSLDGGNLETKSFHIKTESDLYLIGLFGLNSGKNCNKAVSQRNILFPLAFEYSLGTIRERFSELNIFQNLNVGAVVFDTCERNSNAVNAVSRLENGCAVVSNAMGDNVTLQPRDMLAYAAEDGAAILPLFEKDSGIGKLLISTSRMSDTFGGGHNHLSTQASAEAVAAALIALLETHNWKFVSVVASKDQRSLDALKTFASQAPLFKICIAETLLIESVSSKSPLEGAASNVVLLFTNFDDSKYIANHLTPEIIPIYALETAQMLNNQNILGSIEIRPRNLNQKELSFWLENLNTESFDRAWFLDFFEKSKGCAIREANKFEFGGKMCDSNERLSVADYGALETAEYFVSDIDTALFALDGAYRKLCPTRNGLCDEFQRNGQTEFMSLLENARSRRDELQIGNYQIDEYGKMVYVVTGSFSPVKGLSMGKELRVYRNGVGLSPPESPCIRPQCECASNIDEMLTQPFQDAVFKLDSAKPIGAPKRAQILATAASDSWSDRTESYIFLAVNSLLLLATLGIVVLVCVKLYLRVVKGNQSLGICLLFGVICLYATVYLYIFDATEFVCKARYMCPSLAFALCFGVMIAKSVQLRNSETLGYNGYISYWNYWILLLFILAVQAALHLHWLFLRKPIALTVRDFGSAQIATCDWTWQNFLFSLSYIVLLLAFTLFLSLLNRNVKRNYKETKWLLYTTLLLTAMFALWMVAFAMVPDGFRDTVIIISLVCCATVILCLMFGPKLYILLRYEPILLEYPPGYAAKVQLERATSVGFEIFDRDDFGPLGNGNTGPIGIGSGSGSTRSNTSASSGETVPVYQAVVRKKCRSKRVKAPATGSRRNSLTEFQGQYPLPHSLSTTLNKGSPY